jgi:tetratricopeptide (TPR) repeat protein
MGKTIDYTKICFVIMPFKEKEVEGKVINFDKIYDEIFAPAISAVKLPEGGTLIPKRTDKDYFTADIDTEMFMYLEYSRFAFVDITGLNANVFYELGVRHHANQSGTAIFRQGDKVPPFDISHIKAFPYEYQPEIKARESGDLIRKVLTDSLEYNHIDSPVQKALALQRMQGPQLDDILKDAVNATRSNDFNTATAKYKEAILLENTNAKLYVELGLLCKYQGDWEEAADAFQKAAQLSKNYSDAWRELGIAQNKLYGKAGEKNIPSGEEALKKSIEFNNKDFDAYASLGGIYKRMGKFDVAAEMYNKAIEVSNGHPYPLLNAVILQIKNEGIASISPRQKMYLKRAEIPLQKQVTDTPPYNTPWSFFDLSTILLLTGEKDRAVKILEDGISNSRHDWELQTHLDTLSLIKDKGADISGLEEMIGLLESVSRP